MTGFEPICRLADLLPERPVAALVGGEQVALVRLHDDRVLAVGMWCPFAQANVMARGLVGSTTVGAEEVPVIFSPMYKQPFDLRTGACLTGADAALGAWAVRVVDGEVLVGGQVAAERPARGVPAWARAS